MTSQYSFNDEYSTPEVEYKVEELQKRLQYSMANFAQVRFKRAMKMRMLLYDKE